MPSVRHCGSGVRFRSTSTNQWLDEGVILKLPRKHCKELTTYSRGVAFRAEILAEVGGTLRFNTALRAGGRRVCGRRNSSNGRFQTLLTLMEKL